MNTCDTCKYWRTDTEGYGHDSVDSRLGTCKNPKHLYGYHVVETTEVPDDGMHIEDDEGWGMFVGPKFGCVNWSSK